ncbi:transmembrane protein 272-like [Fundulus diaphanus]
MAAPSTGRPVAVTVGIAWKLHLAPPPPRPPRLPVATALTWIIFTVARVIFGLVYFQDCPLQPNIPKSLLGMTFCHLLMILFETIKWENDAARHRGFKVCLQFFLGLFVIIWVSLGVVWVFSIYQPNYDPSAADGLYCNKTLYTFAFWNAVLEMFGFGVLLVRLCKGLLFYVTLSPVETDFYSNV